MMYNSEYNCNLRLLIWNYSDFQINRAIFNCLNFSFPMFVWIRLVNICNCFIQGETDSVTQVVASLTLYEAHSIFKSFFEEL